MIRLHLFGGPLIHEDRGQAELVLPRAKPLALLCYLAHRARPVPRQSLLGIFWPDLDEERGRAALRKAVFLIRKALGDDVVLSRGENVAIAADRLWCDTVAFSDAIRLGRWAEALELYRGELLPGVYIAHSTEFERWLDPERDRLRLAAERAASTLAKAAQSAGRFQEMLGWARRMKEIAALSDEGAYLMILADHALGNMPGALDSYHRHARQLSDEYGVAPSRRLHDLAASIRADARHEPVAKARATDQSSAPDPPPGDASTRHSRFVQGAADIMYEADRRGSFTWVNPAATRVLGFAPEQLVGTHYLDLVRSDYRDAALAFYVRQLEERNPCTYYEVPVVRADGREVWLGQNVQILEGEGVPVGIQAVARDITTQMRVAESQRNLALRDQTTDLYSPRGFHALSEDRIKLALRTNHKLVLLSVQASGAEAPLAAHDLLAVARLLEGTFRVSDVIGRLAERRFAVLALERHERSSPEWLAAVCTRLRDTARAQDFPAYLALTLDIAFTGAADDCTPERLLSLGVASADEGLRRESGGVRARSRSLHDRPPASVTVRSGGVW